MRDERTAATRSNSRVSLTRTRWLRHEHAHAVPTRLRDGLSPSGRGDRGRIEVEHEQPACALRRAVESDESIEILWRVEGEHGLARAPEDVKRLLLDVALAREASLKIVALVDPRPLEQQGVDGRRTFDEPLEQRSLPAVCSQVPE